MRVLLDTHIALSAVAKADRLPSAVRDMIGPDGANVVVSVVTLWEIAIKFGNRRGRPGDMPISGAAARTHLREAGFAILPVTGRACARGGVAAPNSWRPVRSAPAAQALSEPLRLITHDKTVAAYSDTVLLV